jgi:hypothetical protein
MAGEGRFWDRIADVGMAMPSPIAVVPSASGQDTAKEFGVHLRQAQIATRSHRKLVVPGTLQTPPAPAPRPEREVERPVVRHKERRRHLIRGRWPIQDIG